MKRAHWIKRRPSTVEYHDMAFCSNCNLPSLIPSRKLYDVDYCPRCGCKIEVDKSEYLKPSEYEK